MAVIMAMDVTSVGSQGFAVKNSLFGTATIVSMTYVRGANKIRLFTPVEQSLHKRTTQRIISAKSVRTMNKKSDPTQSGTI